MPIPDGTSPDHRQRTGRPRRSSSSKSEGERNFPIVIGIFEATSIDRRVKGMPSPQRSRYDLIIAVVEQMGGEIQDIIISDLKEHTYFAKLRIRTGRRADRSRLPTERRHRSCGRQPCADLRERGRTRRSGIEDDE